MTIGKLLSPFDKKYYKILTYPEYSGVGDQARYQPRVGTTIKATNWDPDCVFLSNGAACCVVRGHPLFGARNFHESARNFRFFEVDVAPFPPILHEAYDNEYKARSVTLKRRITKASPELAPNILAALATGGGNMFIRISAIQLLDLNTNEGLIIRLANKCLASKDNEALGSREAAIRRLDPVKHGDILVNIAISDGCSEAREAATRQLHPKNHRNELIYIAKNDGSSIIRIFAIGLLDPDEHRYVLADIIRNDPDRSVREAALDHLNLDLKNTLDYILRHTPGVEVRTYH